MSDTLKGICLKVGAVSLFTALMAIIKATSDDVPPGQAVFFRSVFALPVLFVWLWFHGQLREGLKTQRPLGHVMRGLAGTASMSLRFFCLGVLAFPDVTALGFTTPLVLTVLAALFLGETVRAFRISMVCLGFAGVLVILWDQISGAPRAGIEVLATGLMLISAALAAFAQMFVRKLVDTENPAAIVFYFMMTTCVLSLLTIPFGWTRPDGQVIALLVLAGLIGGVGQIMVTLAYRHAPASIIAPFDYSAMLLAVAIGYVWFNEVPTWSVVAGATLIIASGVLIIWRERRLGMQNKRVLTGSSR
ncbi:DMT family transporter [Nereida sp. MMG025]|uniref:DMT family transporter n=1 Tax=Nereida sp. MMG025 TaxID=2909981 RepID=UPI001F24C56E|nr:DMT family transporter [Nereida sp. MMG025]MCF6444532.1 DMT family transporter [Nereida sp. MMG025]